MTALSHRYDLVFLFDVSSGNPNGDPDAGSLPRLDSETNQGFVTDVSLKRKVRNYAECQERRDGLRHLCSGGAILNDKHRNVDLHLVVGRGVVAAIAAIGDDAERLAPIWVSISGVTASSV